MKFQIFSLVLAIVLSSALGYTRERMKKDFFKKLEANSYDKAMAPEGDGGPGTPVKVAVSTYILDIHKLDDSNMDFNAHFYFRQSWNDSRLKYDEVDDPLVLRNVEGIWSPDLFFVEEREGSLHTITHPNIFCRIKPSGEVLFSSRFDVVFSCPMDLRYYPHDTQKCTLNIESYAFQRKHIVLEWYRGNHKPVSFAENMTMLEFDLIEATESSTKITYMSGNYSSLQINLSFKRKFGFFVTRLYVPFILLVLMTSLSLWIRAEERYLRLALLLVILYLMVTISTSVNSLTPNAPYTKASDVWIGFCESLVFAAFLEFIVVALIANRESEKNKGEILLSLEPEDKDPKMKSPLSKLMKMFDARKGGVTNSVSLRIDKICRVLFPVIFIIFNIIYWAVYCCP